MLLLRYKYSIKPFTIFNGIKKIFLHNKFSTKPVDVVNTYDEQDILQEIPSNELYQIRDLYSNYLPQTTHVYTFLSNAIKWISLKPDKNYFTFYAPNGDWRSNGTFIAIMQWSCYNIFAFTLENSCEQLYKGLLKTKNIYWNQHIMLDTIHQNHHNIFLKVMCEKNIPIVYNLKTNFVWMPKEKAVNLQIKCPDQYYIKKLDTIDAFTINEVWPHRYEGSLKFVSTFLDMNGGYGIYTKSDNKLASWIVKNQLGILGFLQTQPDQKRCGLGSIVTKCLSKEIASEGYDPAATIIFDNIASKSMFYRIGFQKMGWWCSYIGVGKDLPFQVSSKDA